MKATNKLLALLLSFALIVTMFTVGTPFAQAADSEGLTTVTLRIEDANSTLLQSTKISLSQEDLQNIKHTYFDTQAETSSVEADSKVQPTAAYALAKYVMDHSNAPTTDLTFSYGNPLHIVGEENLAGSYWSYRVNNSMPTDETSGYSFNLDQCPIKNGDSIVLFRQACYDTVDYKYTDYLFFDQDNYQAELGKDLTVSLKKDFYDDSYKLVQAPASNETIMVYKNGSAIGSYTTDLNGMAKLNLPSQGEYMVVASKNDKTIPILSRASALINVSNATVTPTPVPSATPTSTPTTTPSIVVTPAPASSKVSVKKPSIPTKITAKKNGKKVTLSWKKVKKAKGYKIFYSKKAKKSYKSLGTTKKLSFTKKMKKGTFYFRVKSFKITNSRKVFSNNSKAIKIVIK